MTSTPFMAHISQSSESQGDSKDKPIPSFDSFGRYETFLLRMTILLSRAGFGTFGKGTITKVLPSGR